MIPYDLALRDTIRDNIARHHRRVHSTEGLRHAAVAIVLIDSRPDDHDDPFEVGSDPLRGVPGDVSGLDGRMTGVSGGASFLLCRRAARMNRHAGQWALPGGKIDAGETVIEAALRETHEELGLELDESSVLGLLDDYTTRSGFVMTPIVIWAGDHAEVRPDPAEVAHARSILAFQMNPTLEPAAALTAIDAQIEQAYYKTKIATAAQGAADLLRQNIMINLVQDARSLAGQKLNDPAALMIATARANAVKGRVPG